MKKNLILIVSCIVSIFLVVYLNNKKQPETETRRGVVVTALEKPAKVTTKKEVVSKTPKVAIRKPIIEEKKETKQVKVVVAKKDTTETVTTTILKTTVDTPAKAKLTKKTTPTPFYGKIKWGKVTKNQKGDKIWLVSNGEFWMKTKGEPTVLYEVQASLPYVHDTKSKDRHVTAEGAVNDLVGAIMKEIENFAKIPLDSILNQPISFFDGIDDYNSRRAYEKGKHNFYTLDKVYAGRELLKKIKKVSPLPTIGNIKIFPKIGRVTFEAHGRY